MSSAVAERETVTVAKEIPAEGTVTVSMNQIDTERFPNYRKKAKEVHLMDLFHKIKEHKQLTPVVGAWQPDGTIALVAGFCREEVLERIALEKVIRDYNAQNGKEPGQEGFIALGGLGFESRKEREKILQAGGEWAERYKAALKSQNILVRTIVVEDDVDAALKNVVENTYDKPPLIDLCDRIEALCEKGIQQKKIAKALKITEPAVSQHRKIHACPAYLRQLFNGDLSELAKKPEEQTLVREQLLTAVAELERRLSLDSDSRQAISFSHAREFSGAVMNTKEPMSLAGVAKALKDLVVMHDSGKVSESDTPNYGVYVERLRDAKRLGKTAPAEEAAAAPATTPTAPATATPAPATHDLSSISKETSAQFDAAAQKLAAPPAGTAGQVSSGNTAKLPTAATVTPVVSQQPTLSPEEQAKMAEVEAANSTASDGPALDQMDELTGPTTESLIAADGASVVPAVPVVEGQMKTKTTEAPVASKYKPKPPEKIELNANRMLDYASDENVTPSDVAGYLLASIQLFNAVGMEAAEQKINEVFVNYSDGLNKYNEALLNAVREARGEAGLKEIEAMKPKFERPTLA